MYDFISIIGVMNMGLNRALFIVADNAINDIANETFKASQLRDKLEVCGWEVRFYSPDYGMPTDGNATVVRIGQGFAWMASAQLDRSLVYISDHSQYGPQIYTFDNGFKTYTEIDNYLKDIDANEKTLVVTGVQSGSSFICDHSQYIAGGGKVISSMGPEDMLVPDLFDLSLSWTDCAMSFEDAAQDEKDRLQPYGQIPMF